MASHSSKFSTVSVCSSATQSIRSTSSAYSPTFSTRTSLSSQSSTESLESQALASSVTSTNFMPLRPPSKPLSVLISTPLSAPATPETTSAFFHNRNDVATTPKLNLPRSTIKSQAASIHSSPASRAANVKTPTASTRKQHSLRVNTDTTLPSPPIKIVTSASSSSSLSSNLSAEAAPPPPPKSHGSTRSRTKPSSPVPSKASHASSHSQSTTLSNPLEVANINFNKVWSAFVDKSLNTDQDVLDLLQEKAERSEGIPSPQFPNYHARVMPPRLTLHTHRVKFNADADNLLEWQERGGLEDITPKEELMQELFYRVAQSLEDDYGWIRELPAPLSSFRYNMTRPPYPDARRPAPAVPHTTKTNALLLPATPEIFTSPKGHYWCKSIAHQFSNARAHRHITMGLVFHSWMNNLNDVAANKDALPPPIWFLLYAMQAAYPGIFVIREEAECAKFYQTIERGLPPYEILASPECGPFFQALLGRDGYERTCEAAEDARLSTRTIMFIKGSVKTRKRAMSNRKAGLPKKENKDEIVIVIPSRALSTMF
ncbi:hypothetical protein FRB98_000977 [Tulasnella sp. 332]|nr:hypothetical protein FRB98_000977 [Tulasnella sp. 332]